MIKTWFNPNRNWLFMIKTWFKPNRTWLLTNKMWFKPTKTDLKRFQVFQYQTGRTRGRTPLQPRGAGPPSSPRLRRSTFWATGSSTGSTSRRWRTSTTARTREDLWTCRTSPTRPGSRSTRDSTPVPTLISAGWQFSNYE